MEAVAATLRFKPFIRTTEDDTQWQSRCAVYLDAGARVMRFDDGVTEFLGPSERNVKAVEGELKAGQEEAFCREHRAKTEKRLLAFSSVYELRMIGEQKSLSPAVKILMAMAFESAEYTDQKAAVDKLVNATQGGVVERFPTYPLVLRADGVTKEGMVIARTLAAREGLRELKLPAQPTEEEYKIPTLPVFVPSKQACKKIADACNDTRAKQADLSHSVTACVEQALHGINSASQELEGMALQAARQEGYNLLDTVIKLCSGLRKNAEFPLTTAEILGTLDMVVCRHQQAAADVARCVRQHTDGVALSKGRAALLTATQAAVAHVKDADRFNERLGLTEAMHSLSLAKSDDSKATSASSSSVVSSSAS